jgi:hypothetical protein
VKAPPRRLALPLALAGAVLLLWDTPVVYPFRVFVVLLHEVSHGIAAVATGGRIVSIGLTADEGGVCVTRGGSPFLILNAGYLGSLLWGALFLLLGGRRTTARSVVSLVGALTVLATLLYVRTWFGFAYGLVAGTALLLVAARLAPAASELLLATLGATSALYAVWDVLSDVVLRHSGQSDAAALARLTGVPALAWGVLWVALSVVVLASVLRRLV